MAVSSGKGHPPLAEHLGTAECWKLLEGEQFGRLALIGDHDIPDVFPVNFAAHEGSIYIRTAHDSKLVRVATDPVAAFEIDGSDGEYRWSVVIRGPIARLTDEAEIARSGIGSVRSESPRHKPYVLKLSGNVVTGRRFPIVEERPVRPRGAPISVHGGAAAAPDATSAEEHPPRTSRTTSPPTGPSRRSTSRMATPTDARPATPRAWWRAYPYLIAALAAGVVALALQLAGWSLASQIVLIAFTVVMVVRSGIRMLRQLRSGAFGVDLLAVIAIVATLLVAEYWASWVIVLMLSTGEALEDYAGRRAQHDLDELIDRTPRIAHARDENGTVRDVPVDEVEPGDRLVVGAGELVPVDGELLDDVAAIDESSVTGESIPVEKSAGDELLSGTVNGATAISMVVVRRASESQYQSIVRIVEEAARSRPPLVRLADRYAVPFTVFALALAAAAWWISGDPVRFAEVLVVATPCPLLVAAPVAFIAGMSRAAREGIIVKTGGAFEVLVRARTFVFDKTGTLTRGQPALVELRPAPGASPELLRLSAEAEQLSPHVLARARPCAPRGTRDSRCVPPTASRRRRRAASSRASAATTSRSAGVLSSRTRSAPRSRRPCSRPGRWPRTSPWTAATPAR